jgi:hypothetical protein
VAHNFGISNVVGEFELYIPDNDKSGTATFSRKLAPQAKNMVVCKLEQGDAVIEKLGLNNIDFIKIDVEGLEGNVIASLKTTIDKFGPILSIEWNNDITRDYCEKNSIFSDILSAYHFFSISHDQKRRHYSGMASVKRFFRKHILRKQRTAVFTPFYKRDNYEAVLCISPRFAWIIDKLPLMDMARSPETLHAAR